MGTTIEALLYPGKKTGAGGLVGREFGVLIHFIGSEKRFATTCHISLNPFTKHAIVGER